MGFTETSDDALSEIESTIRENLKGNVLGSLKRRLSTDGSDISTSTSEPGPSTSEPVTKKTKSQKEHVCHEPGCGVVFNKHYRLLNHIAYQHEGKKSYVCDYEDCDKSYTNSSHLKRHKVTVHSEEDEAPSQEVICGVENCGFLFSNKYNLKRHVSRCHENLRFKCLTCQEKFHKKSQLHMHKLSKHNEGDLLKCNKCNKTFLHNNLYKKHLSRHKEYKCDCEKVFDTWSDYLKHKKTDCKTPKAQHRCSICDKVFTLRQNLTQHVLKVHLHDSQKDNFQCPYLDCKRSYIYKKNLNCHIKTYHEKKCEYFSCTHPGCEVVLKSKKNLKCHLRTCHSSQPKTEKKRKPRKDKGIPKKSCAAQLCNVTVPYAEHKKTITESLSQNYNSTQIGGRSRDTEENNHEELPSKSTGNASLCTNIKITDVDLKESATKPMKTADVNKTDTNINGTEADPNVERTVTNVNETNPNAKEPEGNVDQTDTNAKEIYANGKDCTVLEGHLSANPEGEEHAIVFDFPEFSRM